MSGVIMIPKRQLLTLIFACLCFKKSILIKNCIIIHRLEETLTKTMSQGTQFGIALRNYALCTSPTE